MRAERLEHAIHSLLADIDGEVLSGATLDQVLLTTCRALVEQLGYPFCWIGLSTLDGLELRAYHGAGVEMAELGTVGIDAARDASPADTPVAPSPALSVLADGERRLTRGADGTPLLAMPLVREDEVLGVFTLWGDERHPFDELTLLQLERLAGRITLALTALRDRERLRLQGAALAAAANAVIITDAAGRIEWVNDAFTRLCGYTLEEAVGNTPRLLESGLVPRATFVELWRTILAGRPWRGELVNRAKGGRLYHVAQTITPILDDEGAASHFVAIHEDISERKLADRRLQEARDAALHASRSKSEFLASISHEIRTPMNGVLGMLGLLAESELDHLQRDYLDSARRSGDLLLTLLNNILDYARIESGRIELERITFDPREVAEDVLTLYLAEAAEKRLELGVLVDPSVPARVVGDPTRLRQILTNLVGNAVKFTALGEVSVTLACTERELPDGVRVELHCRVRDSGIGIPPEVRGRIFDVFTQADGSTSRNYGGSGLGLAICRELVRCMEGEIGVDSEPGRGSTFWFSVLLDAARPSSDEGTRCPSLAGLRLLVVDEHPLSRDVLENQLALSGAEFEVRESPGEALQLLRAATLAGRPLEAVILSIQLPGNAALSLARALADDPTLGTPRLFALVPPGNHTLDRLAALCDGLLRKPLRRDTLLHRLLALRGEAEVEEVGTDDPAVPTARILVADDNPTNQRVTRALVERLGYRVSLVADGHQALELQRRDPHDLILMDVRMPGLDGYQSTAAIRREEQGRRHTPIIALTASTTRGAEQSRRAGMDGFLLKPARPEALREVLDRWLGERAFEVDIPATGAAEGAAGDGIDRHIFDAIRELMGEAFGEVVESFLDDARERLERMRDELADGDAAHLQRTAHTLKGASANLGLSALSAACAALDQHVREAGCDGADGLIQAVERAFIEAEHALSSMPFENGTE